MLGNLIKEKLESLGIYYACNKCKILLKQLNEESIDWIENNFNYIVKTMMDNAQSKEMSENDKSIIGRLSKSRFIPSLIKKEVLEKILKDLIQKEKSNE